MKKPKRDLEALRGRVLLVYQKELYIRNARANPNGLWGATITIAEMARELGVNRQALYRACPELVAPK